MDNLGSFPSRYGLERHGVTGARYVYWNLSPAQLYEEALSRREATLARFLPPQLGYPPVVGAHGSCEPTLTL